jgi:hypothetical protein
MVKIDLNKDKFSMESTKKMEKIQIFPSKQQHHNSFNNKNKPKLIMSPLTTMPSAKKLMIAANTMPLKPIMSAPTANGNSVGAKLEANNMRMPPKVINSPTMSAPVLCAATTVKVIPSPRNEKLPLDGIIETQAAHVEKSNSRKETAVCRSEKAKITLGVVHPYITCFLCKGYLIEATTIVECLHTYCHSCLMKHLSREKCCPQCEMSINKSKTNIK